MLTTLSIFQYKKRSIPFAIFSMLIFRFPLRRNKNIGFYKLMGSGKHGTFSKTPDWQQWAILTVDKREKINFCKNDCIKSLYGSFIAKWTTRFHCNTQTYLLSPIEGHGLWDKKNIFGTLPSKSNYEGRIAVLTRATIRLSKLKKFWTNVNAVSQQMRQAKGFITSYGIGEIPWIKQATFSIWESKEAMKNFAYQTHQHKNVIQKTRQQNWYSEEMFVRFIIEDFITVKQF